MTEEQNQQESPAEQPDDGGNESVEEFPEDRSGNALDNLGDLSTKTDSIDALAAMAAGQDVAPTDPDADELPIDSDQPVQADPTGQIPPEAAAVELSDLAATASAGARTDAFAAAGPPVGDSASRQKALQVRRKRAAALVGQSQRAHAQQFKSFMIPMLIVVGALLFVLATVVALLMPDTRETFNPAYSAWHENPSTKKGLVLIAYPLGAILFLGAYLFYMDLQRHKKE